MGKFDMTSRCTPDLKITYSELYNDIYSNDDCDSMSQNEFCNKLFNSHGSGIIDQLKKTLNFDIRLLAGENRQQKFDMFRVLKLLYVIEKKGEPLANNITRKESNRCVYNMKQRVDFEKYRVPIIKVLKTPMYNNLNIGFPKDPLNEDSEVMISPYGKTLDNLIQQVKIGIDNDTAKKYYRILNPACKRKKLYGDKFRYGLGLLKLTNEHRESDELEKNIQILVLTGIH